MDKPLWLISNARALKTSLFISYRSPELVSIWPFAVVTLKY